MAQRVLLAIHDASVARAYRRLSVASGYDTILVETEDAFREKVSEEGFAHVIVEANFGRPNSSDTAAMERIYEVMKEKISSGALTFTMVSGDDELVAKLCSRGIPARGKTQGISDILKEPPESL